MMYGMVLFVNMKIIGMHAAICNRVVLVGGGGGGRDVASIRTLLRPIC